ncbi:MAG: hypothetical protein ACRCSN_05935 [Dermatophilaceae bacterium]
MRRLVASVDAGQQRARSPGLTPREWWRSASGSRVYWLADSDPVDQA